MPYQLNPHRIGRDMDEVKLVEGQLLYRQNPEEKSRVELFCDLMVEESNGLIHLKRCNLLGSDIGPSVPTITVVEPLYGATRSTLLELSGEESIVFFKYVRFIEEEAPAGNSAKPYSCLLQKTDGSNVSIIAVDGHGQYHTGRSASFEDPSKWSGWEDSLGSRDSWSGITLDALKDYPQRYPSTLDIIEGSFTEDDSPDNQSDSKWYVSCYFYTDHTQILAESLYYQYSNTWDGTKWTGWIRTDGGDKIHYNTDPQVDVTKVELHEVALDDMELVSGTWEDIFSEVEFAETDQPAAGDVAYRVHIKKLADGIEPELGVFTMEAFYENRRFYCEYFDSTTGWSDWIEEATPSNTVFHYPTALTDMERDDLIDLIPPEVDALDNYTYIFDNIKFITDEAPYEYPHSFIVTLYKGTQSSITYYNMEATSQSTGVTYFCGKRATWSVWVRSFVSHSDHDSIRITTLPTPAIEETQTDFISIGDQSNLTSHSIEVGFENSIVDRSITYGSSNDNESYSIIVGVGNTTTEDKDGAVAIGFNNIITNDGVAIGTLAEADDDLNIKTSAIDFRVNDEKVTLNTDSEDFHVNIDANLDIHGETLVDEDSQVTVGDHENNVDVSLTILGDTIVDRGSTATIGDYENSKTCDVLIDADLTIHGETIVDTGSTLTVGDSANSNQTIARFTASNVLVEGDTYIRNEDTTVNIGTNTDPSEVEIDGTVKVLDQAEVTIDEDNLVLKNDEYTFEMARNTTDDEIEIRDLTDPLHPKTLQPFNIHLDDLSDVDVPSPVNGEALVYDDTDPTDKKWVSKDISTGELWGATVGTCVKYTGATRPNGWLLCDGGRVTRAQYPRLYAKIAGIYGETTVAYTTLPTFEDADLALGYEVIFTGNMLEEIEVLGCSLLSDETKHIRFDENESGHMGYVDDSETFHIFNDPTLYVLITGTSGTLAQNDYNSLVEGIPLHHNNTILHKITDSIPMEFIGESYTVSGNIKVQTFHRVVVNANRTWSYITFDTNPIPYSATGDEDKVLMNDGTNGLKWGSMNLADLPDVNAASKGVGKFLTFDPTTNKFTFNSIDVSSMGIVGEIRQFAGAESEIPDGWFFCRGQALSRTAYADLFAVIGTTYGTGDGSTTFNLPDLTSRFIEGCDQDASTHAATNIGTKLNAGIPNSWGSTNSAYVASNDGTYHAPSGMVKNRRNYSDTPTGSGRQVYGYEFDLASGECGTWVYGSSATRTLKNNVYGKSDTVQPAAIKMVPIICAVGFRKQS